MISILVVEDDKDERNIIEKYLSEFFLNVICCTTAEEALEIIKSNKDIQLILLDLNLPGLSGLGFSKIIRESVTDRYIYIIMITGEQCKDSLVLAYENGVDDYITKPFSLKELMAKLKSASRIIKMENHLKEKFKLANEKASYDSLTGCFNRSALIEHLYREFDKHKKYKKELGIVFYDIDYFKKINDKYGHLCGDYILKSVAKILIKSSREYDLLGRYGGEEFLLICPETPLNDIFNIAERHRIKVQNNLFEYKGTVLNITMSGGIASSYEADSVEKLISLADQRLYISKNNGRNMITR